VNGDLGRDAHESRSRTPGIVIGVSTLEIVRFGDPRLRLPGRKVTRFDAKLGRLIDDMVETMDAAPGAGLAAQQVGLDLQVCVIRIDDELYEAINPEIVHRSGEEDLWEGCLSLPGYRALRRRAEHAVMVAQDRTGKRVTISGHGWLARAIQHEYDHLQGELYTDGLPEGAEIITDEELAQRSEAGDEEPPQPD
jgi:peptide deformylase